MKFLAELNQNVDYVIEEATDTGRKSVFIEGIFMQAEKPNRNRRLYPKSIMEREVTRYQQMIDEKRSLGELGHPANPSINLDKVSHLITSLRFEGTDVIGRAKVLDTPLGKIAKNLIEEGVKLGVSSRGLGSISEQKGVNVVQDDFHLATVDIVSDPSAHDAFVQGLMESQDWICENGLWKPIQIEAAQNTIRKATKKQLEEAKLRVFRELLK